MHFFVRTWDVEKQDWTPQEGVPVGPYSQFGLRVAIRELLGMGYSWRDSCVMIESDSSDLRIDMADQLRPTWKEHYASGHSGGGQGK